jgi:hypothetical protein
MLDIKTTLKRSGLLTRVTTRNVEESTFLRCLNKWSRRRDARRRKHAAGRMLRIPDSNITVKSNPPRQSVSTVGPNWPSSHAPMAGVALGQEKGKIQGRCERMRLWDLVRIRKLL